MKLFSRKPVNCAICGVLLKHKHKPKREWNIKGHLCGDCHVTKSKEFHEAKVVQPCVICSTRYRIADMWEPRWQWDMNGLLCKTCFDKKESEHESRQNLCVYCGTQLGRIRYNPKPKWKMEGQLCRKCWDSIKAERG